MFFCKGDEARQQNNRLDGDNFIDEAENSGVRLEGSPKEGRRKGDGGERAARRTTSVL